MNPYLLTAALVIVALAFIRRFILPRRLLNWLIGMPDGSICTPWEVFTTYALEDRQGYGPDTDWRLSLGEGHTHPMIADHILDTALGNPSPDLEAIKEYLAVEAGLSEADVTVALDRTYEGVIRAETAEPPDQSIDPLAWHSYQRALHDRSIVATLCPQVFGYGEQFRIIEYN